MKVLLLILSEDYIGFIVSYVLKIKSFYVFKSEISKLFVRD